MGVDLLTLIKSLGYLGVWGIVFAESGILLAFFLPGDSLLFTAGFIASQGFLNLTILATGCFIAAVTGNMLGYEVGRRIGIKVFETRASRFIKKKHLDLTKSFFMRHGRMAVVMARFLPIIRTFTPFLAGVVGMPYRIFFIYTVVGALLWAVGLTVFGFFLGKLIPPDQIDQYLLPIIIAIVVVSFLPSIYHIAREKRLAKDQETHD